MGRHIPNYLTSREVRAQISIGRHPWYQFPPGVKFITSHPEFRTFVFEMWKDFGIFHEEHQGLLFSVWGERTGFFHLEWEERKSAIVRSRAIYEQLKVIFRDRTAFLHSTNFIPSQERWKHWVPHGAAYSEIREQSKAKRKNSPFFPVITDDDLKVLYWALVPTTFKRFLSCGLSDRILRLPFSIGFSDGDESSMLHFRLEGRNVHAYPTKNYRAAIPVVEYEELSIAPYFDELSNLRKRCVEFAS
jgi:hypothetical protein